MNGIVKPKKRLFISLILVLSIVIVSIISIAIVFAASLQNASTNINITYVIDSVGANISATYTTVSSGTPGNKTAITNSDGTSEIEIAVTDDVDLSNVTYDTTVSTTLDSTTNKVVYEYKFTNTADSSFTIGLTNTISGTNLSVAYKISKTEIPASDYSSDFEDETLMTQLLLNEGETIYIYVSATLTGTSATFSSNSFVWELTRVDEENLRTITLINGDSTGGQTSLKFIYGTNISMPTVYNLPTANDLSLSFFGYYSNADGTGTQYINADGTSAHSADLEDGASLYANYRQIYIIENSAIIDLTALGLSMSSLTIPNGITDIGDNAFEGASAEVIKYEGAATETIAYADSTPLLTAIGANAFANCTNLKELYLPNTITSFNTTPLAGCTSLQKIEFPYVLGVGTGTESSNSGFSKLFGTSNSAIPSTLTTIEINGGTSIETYAFSYCTTITSITIPNSITTLGRGVFFHCSSLSSITIPSSVTSMGENKFAYCTNLTSIEVDDENTVYNDGNGSNCIIETITNKLIEGCKSTIIPETVTCIGNAAFNGCSGLNSVSIPEGVTSIEDYAFYGCSGLSSLSIPEGVKTIGSYAFNRCSGLTSVSIPSSVTSIGNSAFYICSGLTSVTIPEGVTSIGSSAFDGCNKLTSVSIPSSLKSIGASAFYNCSKLAEVNITSIEAWCKITFDNAPSNPIYYSKGLKLNGELLTEIEIPETITKINANAFNRCSSLTSVSIPSSVTSIGNSAFYICTGLTSVTIPEGVTSIGSSAFDGCSKLTSVSIPSSLKSIGSSAFYNCNKLTEVNITSLEAWCKITFNSSDANPIYLAKGLKINGELLTEIEIPETITKINNYAFYNGSTITSVSIPSSVTSIANTAFSHCSGLTSIVVAGGNATYNSGNGGNCIIETDTNTLILGCKSTIIPNTVMSIADAAFFGCTGLTSVSIPSSVTSIANNAFSYCSGLTSIVVAGDNTTYNSGNGGNCIIETATNTLIRGCATTIIPNTVTSIADRAFYGCGSLTSLTIPEGVTSIGEEVFYNCSGLTSIVVAGDNTTYNSGNGANCIIETATNTLILGCKSTIIPNTVTSIADYAFYGCNGLTSLTIPEGVTSIGNFAFRDCSSLTSLTISSSVTSIGYRVFFGCSKLSSVVFENNSNWVVSTTSTFDSTTSLTSANLSNKTTAATYMTSTYRDYYWKRTA